MASSRAAPGTRGGSTVAVEQLLGTGGSAAASYLHLARTVSRRCERLMCELAGIEPVNPAAIKYINRLSDHLFVLSRKLNDNGATDVLWVPGGSR